MSAAALTLFSISVSSASAATTTLEFEETEKGATFAFVDNPPTAPKKHGFPTTISAGDMIVLNNPLLEGGKRIGHLSASCVATKTSKKFDGAQFACNGTFVLPGGTLVASAIISGAGVSEGAITGGTGKYAGVNGTFTTKETKGPASPVKVMLLE
ncbi:MAG TPA: hypothetical protein VGG40_02225 [Solirubrobacterales bacterium]